MYMILWILSLGGENHIHISLLISGITAESRREKFTLSLFSATAASARALTLSGMRARQILKELKMAMVVKAW